MAGVVSKIHLLALVALTLGAGIVLLVFLKPGPERAQTIELSRVSHPPLTFIFQHHGINGFLLLDVYSETKEEFIWRLGADDRSLRPLTEVRYGIVPGGTVQVFPLEGPPRDIGENERILLRVNYQYDRPTGAYASTRIWAIEIAHGRGVVTGDVSNRLLPRLNVK